MLKQIKTSVYRFNVSVNDGSWEDSNHTIWISHGGNASPNYSEDSYIYNNTIIMDYAGITDPEKKKTTAVDINAKKTYIFNNIFYSVNGGEMASQMVNVNSQGTDFQMTNNLYYGDVDNRLKIKDTSKVEGDPLFSELGEEKEKYNINEGSAAIETGLAKTGPAIPNAGYGIFKDVDKYPTVDYYGNPIDLSSGTPNIGASNTYNGEIVFINDNLTEEEEFKLYPNPTNDYVFVESDKIKSIEISNLKGRLLRTELYSNKIFIGDLSKGIYMVRVKTDLSMISTKVLVK